MFQDHLCSATVKVVVLVVITMVHVLLLKELVALLLLKRFMIQRLTHSWLREPMVACLQRSRVWWCVGATCLLTKFPLLSSAASLETSATESSSLCMISASMLMRRRLRWVMVVSTLILQSSTWSSSALSPSASCPWCSWSPASTSSTRARRWTGDSSCISELSSQRRASLHQEPFMSCWSRAVAVELVYLSSSRELSPSRCPCPARLVRAGMGRCGWPGGEERESLSRYSSLQRRPLGSEKLRSTR